MHVLAKFNKSGELEFANRATERRFNNFKNFYIANGEYFKLNINDLEKQSTEAQHKLYFRICHMVAEHNQDEFMDVRRDFEKALLPKVDTGNMNLLGEPIMEKLKFQDLNIKQYNIFLENVINTCNDMFGMGLEIHTNEDFKTIVKKTNE